MSWSGGSASIAATRRIRRLSTLTWVAGALALSVGTSAGIIGAVFAGEYGVAGDPPWLAEQPVEAVAAAGGTEWSGSGDAVLRLPDDIAEQGPLMVTLEQLDDAFLRLFQSRAGDDPAIDWPGMVGFLDTELEPSTVIAGGQGTTLWLQTGGNWRVSIAPLEARELVDTLSGQGEEYLLYRGEALSATASHLGTGAFSIDVYGDEGVEYALVGSDTVDQRFSWNDSEVIVLHVRSTADGGAWSITVDVAGSPEGVQP